MKLKPYSVRYNNSPLQITVRNGIDTDIRARVNVSKMRMYERCLRSPFLESGGLVSQAPGMKEALE